MGRTRRVGLGAGRGDVTGLPHTLTLLATDRCPAACRGCGVGAGPSGTQDLELPAMTAYIDEAVDLGVRLVVLSGGEPFLLDEDLDRAVEHAHQRGVRTRVVSNGYWATSDGAARARLNELKGRGLDELNLSTGPRHQQCVPFETIITGLVAALELELTLAVMIELGSGHGPSRDDLLNDERVAGLVRHERFRRRLVVLESPWVDAPSDDQPCQQGCAIDDRLSRTLLTCESLPRRRGCRSVIGGIAVDPDGGLGACCGITRRLIPELTVGSLHQSSMAALVSLIKRDLLKRWLFTEGPEHILAWAAEKEPGISWQSRYAHQCHACLAVYTDPLVRQVIASRLTERALNVCLRYWLLSQSARVATRTTGHGGRSRRDRSKE